MAKLSKYPDKQIDTITQELIAVFEKHKSPVDLSLVVLGNMVTNLLVSSVGVNQREILAKTFSDALLNSIKNSN
ncbi:YejL family protein [Seminibacterium arietis]|uniref:UPF0352 protein ACFQ02_04650 n=1 Tax=Seminibacterium arietis TaxID=1173502 RepID=A0ABW3I8H9_9PAST